MKKPNTNLIGNIVILVSIVLVFLMFAIGLMSFPSEVDDMTVKWNNLTFHIEGDSDYVMTNDSIVFTSKYPSHNIQLNKTSNLSGFKKNIENADYTSILLMEFNSTHNFIVNDELCYGAIVPKDSVISKQATYKINGTPEIIEVFGNDSNYIISFVGSSGNPIELS